MGAVLQARGKICALHAHASNLRAFRDLIPLTGCPVIEAFTPPSVGDLSLREARQAWGKNTVIWINFPETVFWGGAEATRRYTADLLNSDPPGDALVIGFTEMGFWGAGDDHTADAFRAGTTAIMEAIAEHGRRRQT